jgi:predicted adenylyl cyclase CyaB
MPRNVEIKARLLDRAAVETTVRERADHGPTLIAQHDVFFRCDRGRLKLRVFADGSGELIFYRRLDTEGPTESEFRKTHIDDPDSIAATLGAAYGTAGTVRKRRTLYRIGRTRVHLDAVEGLGDFLELEVTLEPGDTTDTGARIAEELMEVLGIGQPDLIADAYVDMLNDT